jgi:hypothetical protein
MIVGDQGAFDGGVDGPVVPDHGVEGEEALHDSGPQSLWDTPVVLFEAELVFQGPDDRLDALAQPVWEGPGCLLVFACWADQQVQVGEEPFTVLSGQTCR